MKKFIFKIGLFLLLLFIYDKSFILIGELSATLETDKRLERLLQGKINKDVIIIGSSTGSRGILAGEITEKTGLTAYNLCYPGSNVEFHDFILRTLVTFNEIPKHLLLIVDDDTELLFDERTIFRNDRMYPLVAYPFIRKELINRGEKDRFFSRFIVLHQLNKANFDLRKKRFTPLDTIVRCGSMPISWQRDNRDWHYIDIEKEYFIDQELPEKVKAFSSIVETCHEHNIDLTVVIPPTFKIPGNAFMERMQQMCYPGTRLFLYDTSNKFYSDKSYYYDEEHLNIQGAKLFTDEIINYLGIITN